jgi:hypothetical protein
MCTKMGLARSKRLVIPNGVAMAHASFDLLPGRQAESRRLAAAIRGRESLLIWGPADAGKTALVKTVIDKLPGKESRNCIYWSGAATVRHLVGELVRLLYLVEDPVVCKKVRDVGAGETSLNRWLREQTTGRLKVLLYTAMQKGRYWFFLDHLPPATHAMARLMKDVIWRCKTPVYLLARGCSHAEIGYAWSIYFTPQYYISLGPLPECASHELLEQCIRRFGLASLDLEGFREDVLRLSGQLPGSIIKMCELAADPRYRYGDQLKIKLIHVDYLLRRSLAYARFDQGHVS